MDFRKKKTVLLIQILLVLLGSFHTISANTDCGGKAFHCVNSTHFKICVDLGRGISSTVDDYLISCPVGTGCLITNHFECEFLPSTTPIEIIQTSEVANESEWIGSLITTVVPPQKTSEVEHSEKLETSSSRINVQGTTDIITTGTTTLNVNISSFEFNILSNTDSYSAKGDQQQTVTETTTSVDSDKSDRESISSYLTTTPDYNHTSEMKVVQSVYTDTTTARTMETTLSNAITTNIVFDNILTTPISNSTINNIQQETSINTTIAKSNDVPVESQILIRHIKSNNAYAVTNINMDINGEQETSQTQEALSETFVTNSPKDELATNLQGYLKNGSANLEEKSTTFTPMDVYNTTNISNKITDNSVSNRSNINDVETTVNTDGKISFIDDKLSFTTESSNLLASTILKEESLMKVTDVIVENFNQPPSNLDLAFLKSTIPIESITEASENKPSVMYEITTKLNVMKPQKYNYEPTRSPFIDVSTFAPETNLVTEQSQRISTDTLGTSVFESEVISTPAPSTMTLSTDLNDSLNDRTVTTATALLIDETTFISDNTDATIAENHSYTSESGVGVDSSTTFLNPKESQLNYEEKQDKNFKGLTLSSEAKEERPIFNSQIQGEIMADVATETLTLLSKQLETISTTTDYTEWPNTKPSVSLPVIQSKSTLENIILDKSAQFGDTATLDLNGIGIPTPTYAEVFFSTPYMASYATIENEQNQNTQFVELDTKSSTDSPTSYPDTITSGYQPVKNTKYFGESTPKSAASKGKTDLNTPQISDNLPKTVFYTEKLQDSIIFTTQIPLKTEKNIFNFSIDNLDNHSIQKNSTVLDDQVNSVMFNESLSEITAENKLHQIKFQQITSNFTSNTAPDIMNSQDNYTKKEIETVISSTAYSDLPKDSNFTLESNSTNTVSTYTLKAKVVEKILNTSNDKFSLKKLDNITGTDNDSTTTILNFSSHHNISTEPSYNPNVIQDLNVKKKVETENISNFMPSLVHSKQNSSVLWSIAEPSSLTPKKPSKDVGDVVSILPTEDSSKKSNKEETLNKNDNIAFKSVFPQLSTATQILDSTSEMSQVRKTDSPQFIDDLNSIQNNVEIVEFDAPSSIIKAKNIDNLPGTIEISSSTDKYQASTYDMNSESTRSQTEITRQQTVVLGSNKFRIPNEKKYMQLESTTETSKNGIMGKSLTASVILSSDTVKTSNTPNETTNLIKTSKNKEVIQLNDSQFGTDVPLTATVPLNLVNVLTIIDIKPNQSLHNFGQASTPKLVTSTSNIDSEASLLTKVVKQARQVLTTSVKKQTDNGVNGNRLMQSTTLSVNSAGALITHTETTLINKTEHNEVIEHSDDSKYGTDAPIPAKPQENLTIINDGDVVKSSKALTFSNSDIVTASSNILYNEPNQTIISLGTNNKTPSVLREMSNSDLEAFVATNKKFEDGKAVTAQTEKQSTPTFTQAVSKTNNLDDKINDENPVPTKVMSRDTNGASSFYMETTIRSKATVNNEVSDFIKRTDLPLTINPQQNLVPGDKKETSNLFSLYSMSFDSLDEFEQANNQLSTTPTSKADKQSFVEINSNSTDSETFETILTEKPASQILTQDVPENKVFNNEMEKKLLVPSSLTHADNNYLYTSPRSYIQTTTLNKTTENNIVKDLKKGAIALLAKPQEEPPVVSNKVGNSRLLTTLSSDLVTIQTTTQNTQIDNPDEFGRDSNQQSELIRTSKIYTQPSAATHTVSRVTTEATMKPQIPRPVGIHTNNNFDCKSNPRGRHADTNDCRKFYICISTNQQAITGACPENTVFSSIKKQCTKNLSHCIRNNQFQCTSDGRFIDFLQNNVYYICVKNRLNAYIKFKFQCQNGFVLDRKTVKCLTISKKDVSSSPQTISTDNNSKKEDSDISVAESKSEPVSVSKEKSEFRCEKEGTFADPNNCRIYFVCKKRHSEFRRKRKRCDSDELFNKDRRRCVDAESYECHL